MKVEEVTQILNFLIFQTHKNSYAGYPPTRLRQQTQPSQARNRNDFFPG
jgi:hypothetical protein